MSFPIPTGTFTAGPAVGVGRCLIREHAMAGTMDKVKGSVKDAVGRATGNTRLQAEGKMDKAKGHAEDLADRLSKGADKVSDAAKGVQDSLKK